MKTCTKCGETFPATTEHFYKHKKWGLYSHCKACHKLNTRAWVLANPEKTRESMRKADAKRRLTEEYKAYQRARYHQKKAKKLANHTG